MWGNARCVSRKRVRQNKQTNKRRRVTDSIRRNKDAGQLTGAIFVDFRKAFYTIDHEILPDKLQMFGICGNELRWMTDYLTNRTQSVLVGGVLSCSQLVVSGVPQGSILGPLLFALYTSQICRTVCKLPMRQCTQMIPSSITLPLIQTSYCMC